MAVNDL